jgi:hypothetical protein
MGMKRDILQEIEEKQLRWYGRVMHMEDCVTARWVAQWNLQGRQVSTWKDEIRDSMQRRNHKDEEYFDRQIWWKKHYVFGLRKTMYSQKNSFN